MRPAPQDPPGKFETGTGDFEVMCGVLGALEYIDWVGENLWCGARRALCWRLQWQAPALQAGYVRYPVGYELGAKQGAAGHPGGNAGGEGLWHHGYPTPGAARAHLFFHVKGKSLRQVAEEWMKLISSCGTELLRLWRSPSTWGWKESGGIVRVSPVHYNTLEEIEEVWGGIGEDCYVLNRLVFTRNIL